MATKISATCTMLPWCDLDDVMYLNRFLAVINKLDLSKETNSFISRYRNGLIEPNIYYTHANKKNQ